MNFSSPALRLIKAFETTPPVLTAHRKFFSAAEEAGLGEGLTSSATPPKASAVLERVQQAIAGDRSAVSALVKTATPVIQARAARILLRRRTGTPRDVRQEVEDLTQHVLLLLFANDAEFLRRWDPARGASFENYVGLIAEREIISILRSRKRSPWGEEPTEAEEFDALASGHVPTERAAISGDLLRKAVMRAEQRLSGRGLEMLHWIVIEGRAVEEVVEVSGLAPDAVYTWKSRILKLLRSILEELAPDSNRLPRTPREEAEP